MTQAKLIVAGIARIDAPAHRPGNAGAQAAATATVHLADGQTAHLDPADSRSPGRLEVLAELQQLAHPVSLEVDAGSTVTALRIPLVARVARLQPDTGGDIAVVLHVSAAAHYLRAAQPDFQRLRQALTAAAADHGEVIVTETDAHDIIDVRPHPGASPPAPRATAGNSANAPSATQDWTQTSITQERFIELLASLKATTSDPRNPGETSIPFNYPDDGCWARAHEMCRLLVAQGVTPGKAWADYVSGRFIIRDFLQPRTRNHSLCKVKWYWHVAPVVRVSHGGVVKNYIFDPATEFIDPRTIQIWWESDWREYIQVPGTAPPTYHYSEWNVYRLKEVAAPTDTYDNDYTQTNADLAKYRALLKSRIVENRGAGPPFDNCTWHGNTS